MISKGSFLAAAGLFVATIGFAATASATTITFEADSVGFKANGFASAESSDVTFADSIASDLNVGFRSPEATNQRIVVNGDDASKLLMNFLFPINFLSIDFGNDDPGFSSPGDIARLWPSTASTRWVTDVAANRDDLVNQDDHFLRRQFQRRSISSTLIRQASNHHLIEVAGQRHFSGCFRQVI